MKQIVQPIAGGQVEVLEVPRPVPDATEILVRTVASVISPGTERAVTSLARSSLLAKARARPDLVRQVARKARSDGFTMTARAVRNRLAGDVPLGYSAAGIVVAVGSVVTGICTGQLVATGGAGKANHAEYQAVPGLLCTPVPDGVPAADAAFATIASVALHGLRLAEVGPGSKVAIVGLGLIGQLASRLAIASGCDVTGIDPSPMAREVALRSGVLALDEAGPETTARMRDWSRGRGADAVVICAADASSRIVNRAPELCRDRAAVVAIGDVGLHLDRTPFYERELSLRIARSYGPGRYDPAYEAWGVDYPEGYVRWTEGRNFEAVLDLLAAGRLEVADLVTHTYPIDEAAAAYDLIERRAEPYLAIQLSYPDAEADGSANVPSAIRPVGAQIGSNSSGVGWLGAGSFSTSVLLPAFRSGGFGKFTAISSAGGLSARRAAERHGFARAVSGSLAVIDDPEVDVVVVATPHGSHAELAKLALDYKRHVYCEKPLALSLDELAEVERAWRDSGRQLAVGFNRRWSPAVVAARDALANASMPKLLVYRVAAGQVPAGHWYHDRRQGGRLLGEVCHFVDTAEALIGAPIEDVRSLGGRAPGSHPGDEAIVSLRFADGSLATIAYGSAQPTAGKEMIEVLMGPHRLVIDDFRSARLDGRVLWKGKQDKGHRACVTAFREAITGEAILPTVAMLATMRATIQAAAADSLR